MTRFKLLIAAAFIVSASAGDAQGIPVFDSTQYVGLIQQVTNSAQQIQQGVQQIQQAQQIFQTAQQTYNSLSKLTSAASVAGLLNLPSIRQILPSGTSFASVVSGNPAGLGALAPAAATVQQQYALTTTDAYGHSYSGASTDAYNAYLKSVNGGSAANFAYAQNNYQNFDQRTAGYGQLLQSLSTSQDPKDSIDLGVRATMENVAATNDMLKLKSVETMQQAQSDLVLKQYWATRARSGDAALSAALIPAAQ